MNTYTPREISIYLAGMEYAEQQALKARRGQTSRQVNAIRQERAKLSLQAEKCGMKPTHLALEFLGVVLFFGLIVALFYLGYAVTGEPI